MKICYIADVSSIHVTEWLMYFQKKGHEIHIISDIDCRIDDVKVHNIGSCLTKIRIPIFSTLLQIRRKVRKIKQILKEIRPDILHAHYATNYGFLGAKSGFHPYFLTCHGSDINVDLSLDRISRYFVKTALIAADVITLPSDEMLEKVVTVGIRREKITQIQYGIEIEKYHYSDHIDGKIEILSTRNLEKKYRIDLIIDAAPLILTANSNVQFEILGDGNEIDNLEKQSIKLNVSDNIKFYGWVEHSKIPDFYTASQIYVTSSPTDGISISLLEAFAGGCYPIIPDNTSNRLIQSMGFTVKLFNLNDTQSLSNCIIETIKHLPEYKSDLLNNRNLVSSKFSREKNLEIVNQLYKNETNR